LTDEKEILMDTLRAQYRRLLEPWPAAMRRHLYAIPGRPDRGCYGPGNNGHWAIQANNTAAGALAVLATDPELDTGRTGMSRDELLAWALRLVRFSLVSHHAGGGATINGQPWGHTWISCLGLERMMHGVDALAEHLSDEDRERLERVLVSECDWLMDAYHRGLAETPGAITAGLTARNHPENNIWNGAMLHRTARRFPDTPRRDAYLEKGTAFLLNGISIEADAHDRTTIAGRPLADWHVDANFFPSYALNHHGYLNVGYMVICLSNIAMLHFACRTHGWQPPEALYHHARELWGLVKTCTFPDGRLWRIGGDTRVRYCYCQDYAIPTWLLARDVFGDPEAATFESRWLSILATETAANPDDAFLSARLQTLESVSPLYYARLEGDRAAALSMGASWHRLQPAADGTAGPPAALEPPTCRAEWADDYHGSVMTRGPGRLAAWTWRAAEAPQGQCLPPTDSSMAEWRGNLAGRVRGLGLRHETRCEPAHTTAFPGGFVTCGRVTVTSRQDLAEGACDYDAALIDLACAALPDDRTMVVLQRARTPYRVWLREAKGLFLQIPNDLFNGYRRTLSTAHGETVLPGCTGTSQTHPIEGDWLNLDNRLSVIRVYGPPLCIHQPADRQITIKDKPQGGGTLFADEICCGCLDAPRAVDPDTVLFDLGAVMLAGTDAARTRDWIAATAPQPVACPAPDARAVTVNGADGQDYLVVANFGTTELELPLTGSDRGNGVPLANVTDEADPGGARTIVLAAGHAGVVRRLSSCP